MLLLLADVLTVFQFHGRLKRHMGCKVQQLVFTVGVLPNGYTVFLVWQRLEW